MNSVFRNMVEEHGPKFNRKAMEGLSRIYMDRVIDYLDSVIKSAIKTLGDDINLEYVGWRKLTPKEDYYNNINSSNSKNRVDISRNYLIKVEFGFVYEGTPINRVIALPFVDRGGYLKLSDADYALVPVLSEYPISPAPGEVFVRLLRDKLNIKKMDRNILINGEKETKQVIISKSYKLLDKVNDKVPLVLYLVIKYGILGMFEKYFGFTPKIVFGDMDLSHLYETHNVYTTTGIKPRGLNVPNYIPHSIKIVVPKDKVTPFLETIIAGLIYSFDLAPVFAMGLQKVIGIKKEPNTNLTFENIDNESLFWVSFLGRIIFKGKYTPERRQADMLEHINILNGYLDNIIKEKLKEIDIYVDDFYELIAWVIEHYNDLVLNHEKYSSNLKNRYIDLPYYILFDIIVGINKAFLEFKRTASKKKLTEKEINRLFNKYLSTKKIFGLIKNNGVNIAIMPIDLTNDSLYFKMTAVLEDQNRGNGVKRSKQNVLPPNTRQLSAEDLMFGSILHLIKKYPSPRFRINPFVEIDINSGKILVNGSMRETLSKLSDMLDAKFEDQDILEAQTVNDENYRDEL